MSREVSILLVDDDDVDIMAVKRAFKKLRIANPIHVVHNGTEALEVLRATEVKRPRLVLLDLDMPIMGGLEFLDALRSDDTLEDTVVFVLTTSEAEEDRVAAYRKHVAGYMVKSRIEEEFVAKLSMLETYWKVVQLP